MRILRRQKETVHLWKETAHLHYVLFTNQSVRICQICEDTLHFIYLSGFITEIENNLGGVNQGPRCVSLETLKKYL